jgi:glycine/D-amino acid oxidase-like deaminating enzyme
MAAGIQQSFDVIVVGGGVMGCSTTYHLLRASPNLRVAVVERDPTYQHASTVLSDGNVRVQFNLEENIRISQHTLEVLDTFADDMETPNYRPEVGARHQGNLFLADETTKEDALSGLELQQALGCDVEWLDIDEVGRRFPAFRSPTMVGGTFGARDGSVEPGGLLRGYRAKAMELGAEMIDDEVATLLSNGRVMTGVRLADGTVLRAPHVVNSAGAWAPRLAAAIGAELPVVPIMRTVYVVATTVDTAGLPSVFLPSGVYAIPESGTTWLMAWSRPEDPEGFDFTPASRDRFEELIWPALVEHLPAFDQLRVERSWAGLYDVNVLDGNAILGEWPTISGLHVASGFSGHGLQQSPAVGRYLAETILDLPHVLDLSRFGPQRCIDGEPLYEHAGRLI